VARCPLCDGAHGARAICPAVFAANVTPLPPGTLVADRYRIVGLAGEGGTAIVYQAKDEHTGRSVALKFLADQKATELERRRFRQDAELAGRVDHPHVVAIYETRDWLGDPFIAMEYVDGPTLAEAIPELGWGRLVSVVSEIAEALDTTHAQGIVHRDLSPENILLGPEGAKLLDFGIARGAWSTLTGSLLDYALGRFEYMAPEQALDPRRVTAASDIFALAAIVYEALTGRAPHGRDDDGEGVDARQLVSDRLLSRLPPPDPSAENPSIPYELAAVLLKALSFEPEDRFESARALAAAMARVGRVPIQLRARRNR
jgi:serine/threonine protein kinase